MRRVAVVGPGGAGKSTFAQQLGRRLGIPVVHLDAHHWGPGWNAAPPATWRATQVELFSGERWIADGNYGATFDIRFERADTVIVLAPPRIVCVAGALRRSLRRHGEAIQAPGCPERLDIGFLRWIWRYRSDSRPRLDAALERHAERLRVVELRSRREADAFLVDLDEPPDPRAA